MNRPFTEVFRNLKLSGAALDLLPHMEVTRIARSRDGKSLLVYTVIRRLADRKTLSKIEKAIDVSCLRDMGLKSALEVLYDLPVRYTLDQVLDAWGESLFEELAAGSPVSARFFEKAFLTSDSGNRLVLLMEDHPLVRLKEREWKERIRQIMRERFLMDVTAEIRYAEAKEKPHLRMFREEPETVPAPEAEAGADILGSERPDPWTQEAAKTETAEAPEATAVLRKPGPASGEGHAPAKSLKNGKKRASGASVKTAARKQDGAKKTLKRASKAAPRPAAPGDPDVVYGRRFEDESHPIGSYSGLKEEEMVISGRILSVDVHDIRGGEKQVFSFALTDETDSIMVKLFLSNEDAERLKPALTKGACVKVRGFAQFDPYDKELTIRNVVGILKTVDTWTRYREDHAPVKRVELHCHTKASDKDGLADVSDLIASAKRWGHRALAVTDHGNVYAFPEAFHALKKDDGFKVIYGMEGYLVDDTQKTVDNPMAFALEDPCVVFDIETTGFSPVEDRIIEIGAVKMRDGEVTDRFSAFVNPGVPIPYRIEQLTHISDETVRDAPPIEQVLPEFLAFAEGCYLVAHNARFDISFIREKAAQLGLSHEPFAVADTLGIARAILAGLKSFNLDTLSKELNVTLESHHRAVNDAEATAGIYAKLLSRLKHRGYRTLKDLEEGLKPSKEALKTLHPYHVILLAANETGRVNLYKLVSASCLEFFGGRPARPKIPKSLLSAHREGLIVGSACSAGELFSAVLDGASEETLRQIVSYYDYLEVQPLGNNEYLFRDGAHDVRTEEDLQALNRKILELGERYGKPVCATGDVHFLNPEDALYRAILQAGSGYKESEEQPPLYLRTTEEMLKEFEYLGAEKAYEIVVTNTNLIADRIEKIAPVRPDKCPPVIPHADEDLRDACFRRAHALYGDPLPKIVQDRLDRELTSIIGNGYAVMYMIAEKLVSKSVNDGYLVGSRGSVGSSLAATMSGITEVNPLKPHYRCPSCRYSEFDSEETAAFERKAGCDMPDKDCPVCGTKMVKDGFNIPFETFLGFKGDKEPDIDLNFSGEYQSKAHAYTEVIFGKGQTFRAGTVGTVAEKTAFGYTLHYFEENGMIRRRAEVGRIASHIEGVIRTSGQHPGGIIVLPIGEDINTFTPVQHPANDPDTPIITTHFDYHSIDHNLLKLDILGHDDPTMIRMLQDLTGEDPTHFPLDSPEVMRLFADTTSLGVTPEDIRGVKLGTLGIPEFGTDFAMNMVLACKPRYLSDLVRIAGMAHGTGVWTGNNQELISNGTATIETAICCRDDIMEYLIGMGMDPSLSFTIMEAVRKGKGLKPEWETEMRAHAVPEWYIWSCNKIGYMFPKAHAAAYVMMAWRIAYCKVFYPLEYYCAFFTIRAKAFNYEKMCLGRRRLEQYMDEYERSKTPHSAKDDDEYRDMRIVQEMYARGFGFVPIDLYRVSPTQFKIVDATHLMPPLTSIDGMGESAAVTVPEALKGGPFSSVADFRDRTKVTQTIIDKMAALHILDGLPKEDQLSLFDLQ